ncbi:MAG: ribosome recycling factor [Bacteroidetes bacterium]|jgi:ribosome recycling factor|nr:ribosome recycling factor [Bacteroidota bacterium]
MEPEIKAIYDSTEQAMKKGLEHYESELLKIRAGKASPIMLEGVRANYYGTQSPISQMANISAQDARTLVIQPYDKGAIRDIEKAIVEANLGFNPQNDGIVIRITIPQLTEDRRKQLVKVAKDVTEECRISVRNARRDGMEALKKLVKDDGFPEDLAKAAEAEVEKLTKTYNSKVDAILTEKEAEIMHV